MTEIPLSLRLAAQADIYDQADIDRLILELPSMLQIHEPVTSEEIGQALASDDPTLRYRGIAMHYRRVRKRVGVPELLRDMREAGI